jgi:hypothetical protein
MSVAHPNGSHKIENNGNGKLDYEYATIRINVMIYK